MEAPRASTRINEISAVEDALRLSVIVPLAPDETAWHELIDQLIALPSGSEVIVVHADQQTARDKLTTPESDWLAPSSLRQYVSQPGRAQQQNLGARVARGRWLWFVHADSRLQPDTMPALERFLRRSDDALGYFDLVFMHDGPRLAALNAWGANLRSHWLQLPFGDQGLLLPAARFAALGGFDETVRYGEDHLLVWAARHAGLSIVGVGASLQTSARKYARHGWLRTTLKHWRLTATQAWPQWHGTRRGRS